jgi:hypothetical protein
MALEICLQLLITCGAQQSISFHSHLELFSPALTKLTNFCPPLSLLGLFLFLSNVSAWTNNTLSCRHLLVQLNKMTKCVPSWLAIHKAYSLGLLLYPKLPGWLELAKRHIQTSAVYVSFSDFQLWCIKIGIVLVLHFNPWVEASAGVLLVPEGLFSQVAKYFGTSFKIRI